FAGIGAWFAVNGLLFAIGNATRGSGVGGGPLSLLALGVNVAMIVVPAAKGYKGFAVGFALGYAVAFVLFLGACFLVLANFNSR
ncbi:MAG: hypothetical protein ABI808_13900, partial [Pseudonocardiales bacterium]